MHDGQSLRRARERHVHAARPHIGRLVHRRRLNDDYSVHLETLHHRHRHDRELCLERLLPRAAECEACCGERCSDVVDHVVGAHHRHATIGDRLRELGRLARDRRRHSLGCGRHDARLALAFAHRSRRRLPRRSGGEQTTGELHDLARNAVADRQLGHARIAILGQQVEHVAPVAGRERPGGLRDVADHRHRTVQRAARHHLQLHRREVLHFVDDDVAVLLGFVVLVDHAAFARLGPEQVARRVEQRHVGVAEHRGAQRLGARTIQRLDFFVGEDALAGFSQECL